MLMFTNYKIFHIILSKLKGNSEEGDNVFDGVSLHSSPEHHRTQDHGKEEGGA